VEERWMGAWNLRKAGVFPRTVRGWLSVFSPKLSDECAGRLPIVCTAANSLCHTRRWRQIGNCGPGVFVRSPGWRAFCVCRVRGIISSPADLYAVEVSCWGQM
jgi:hypothetical protein